MYSDETDCLSAGKAKELKEDMLYYFETPEEYAVNQNLQPFADMIAILEEKQLDRYLEMMRP